MAKISGPADQMRALVLHAIGDLRYEAVAKPVARPGEVLLRIAFSGICGSDIPRIFVKGTYNFPTVCGHEFSGIVEEIGPGVTRVVKNDRVAVFPLIWCGKCDACEEGKYVQCTNYDYLGSRSDGGFAEFVVVPEQNLVKIPDEVSMEEAAMVEPAAVALHAVRRAGISRGDTVAVFGAGPIGVMVAQWARAEGATSIFIFDINDNKLALTKTLGFSDVYNNNKTDVLKVLEKELGGNGVHVAIEAAGVPPTAVAAIAAVRRAGTIVFLGNPSADVTIPKDLISQMLRRELSILGTWNSEYSVTRDDDDWQTTLKAMKDGSLNVKPLMTHTVPLSGGIGALEMMRDGNEFHSKVLLAPNVKSR